MRNALKQWRCHRFQANQVRLRFGAKARQNRPKVAAKQAFAVKNRLKLAFAKVLAPVRVWLRMPKMEIVA